MAGVTAGRARCRSLYWSVLSDGRFYPFELRARKAEVLHRTGNMEAMALLCREDLARGGGEDRVAGFCLMKLGVLAAQRGDSDAGHRQLCQALECFRRLGDVKNIFFCRSVLVNINLQRRQYPEAETTAAAMAAEAESSHDHKALSAVLNLQGLAAMEQQQHQRAMELFRRKLELAQSHKLMADQATALGNMGCVLFDQGRYNEAASAILESIAICRTIGDLYAEYYAVYNLGRAYEGLGRLPEALRCYQDDLTMARQLGDGPGERTVLEDIGRVEKTMKGH